MVLDYSKWDALELSDDSDIEVHPNVDKRSFIRAKQSQIHAERESRRLEIKTLKYERILNDGLLSRIDELLSRLRTLGTDANPDTAALQTLVEAARNPDADTPPPPPDGVHAAESGVRPTYSQMLGGMLDEVKKELDKDQPADRAAAYVRGVEGHRELVRGLQEKLFARLAELEKIEESKITSESIHTGFDRSQVSKEKEESSKAHGGDKQSESVELLNPGTGTEGSASKAAVKEDEGDDENIKVTQLAREFARVPQGDYGACLRFIQANKTPLLTERKTDELLIEAFDAQLEGKPDYARQCVHQGLLLQYCRSLGPDGISLFFKRITTPDHRAAVLFRDDVNDTYNKIKTRAGQLASSTRADQPEAVEQIQLHAVDPNTKLNIAIPPSLAAGADGGADGTGTDEHAGARRIFASFPPDLQEALRSESLDRVNAVLGRMAVAEAEDVVEKLGDSGILTVEEGIVDATTEEGRRWLETLEGEGQGQVKGEIVGEEGEEKGKGKGKVEAEEEDVGGPVD